MAHMQHAHETALHPVVADSPKQVLPCLMLDILRLVQAQEGVAWIWTRSLDLL